MFSKKEEKEPDLCLFTLFDTKAKAYGTPVFEKNKNVLIRELVQMCRDPKQQDANIVKYAEDFQVFQCGAYDKLTGTIISQALEHVANMHDLKAQAQS